MTTGGQGGYREPQRPAAVSGPGALSQRTDGGPGGRTQPVRVPSGGAYGERAAAEAQQGAAPMEAGGPGGAPPGGAAAPAPAAPSGGAPGVFGPTARPGEALTAGTAQGPEMQLTADELLRIMYRKRSSPWIARLIRE